MIKRLLIVGWAAFFGKFLVIQTGLLPVQKLSLKEYLQKQVLLLQEPLFFL